MECNILLLLKQLSLSLDQYGRNQMKRLSLSPSQSLALIFLFSRDGHKVYAVDFHESFGISKSAVSSAIKELRKKGYVKTAANPQDDRMKQIFLTQKAFAVKEQIEKELQEEQNRLCGEIPRQSLEIMEKALHTMISNLRQELVKEKQTW